MSRTSPTSALAWRSAVSKVFCRSSPPAAADAGQHQHQRGFALPRRGEQPRLDRHLVALIGGDGQRLRAVVGAELVVVRLDEQRVEAAGLFQRVQLVVAGPVEEGAVGIDQLVEPIDQHADRQAVEDRALIGARASARSRLAARLGSRGCAARLSAGAARRSAGAGCFSTCSGLSLGPRSRAVRRFASSLNALRSTGVSAGTPSAGVDAGNGTTFTGGGTTRAPGARRGTPAVRRAAGGRRRGAARLRQFVDARDIAANAEAAIAAEVAVAVEHRKSGQFDRQAACRCRRPGRRR